MNLMARKSEIKMTTFGVHIDLSCNINSAR
jgi:hypothetical protein